MKCDAIPLSDIALCFVVDDDGYKWNQVLMVDHKASGVRESAKVFHINHFGLDHWAIDTAETQSHKSLPETVKASSHLVTDCIHTYN